MESAILLAMAFSGVTVTPPSSKYVEDAVSHMVRAVSCEDYVKCVLNPVLGTHLY